VKRITGIGKRLGDLSHIPQDASELMIIGRWFFVSQRKRSIEVDLVPYLDEPAFLRRVIGFCIIADPAVADGFGKLLI
jgi:hypothetical protein